MNSTLSARRTTNPTQKSESVFSLWALPFFFFLLSVGWGGGQRNHAACLPRLFLNGLLFVLLRMHFQSHPQLPYLQNFQKNKRLTSSLSTLAIFFLEFPFAGPKAQRSVSALEDEFVSLLNALFHKRKKYSIFQFMSHSYLCSSPFLSIVLLLLTCFWIISDQT